MFSPRIGQDKSLNSIDRVQLSPFQGAVEKVISRVYGIDCAGHYNYVGLAKGFAGRISRRFFSGGDMIKHVFCIGILLACIVSPFAAQDLPLFMASGGIATAFAAEGHEDKAHQKKKHAQKTHREKAQESSGKHDDADDELKNRKDLEENKDTGETLPTPTPPVPTPPTPTPPAPVVDVTPPSIASPGNITQEAIGTFTPVTLGVATVTDNVDMGLIATPTPVGPFALGVHTITWSATDAAGNTGSATQAVTITDTTSPVISAPVAITANSSNGQPIAVAIGQATASDAFTPVSISSNAPAVFPISVTTVTWTATDANGNSATASQIVTVTAMDSIPPVVTVPAAVTLEATGAITPVALGTATAMDAVNGALAVSNNAPPAGFPVGVTTVTYSATDAAGNIGTATQTVTIKDTTPPVISIQQPAVTIEAIPPKVTVSLGVVTATDLVDGALTAANNAPAIYSMGVTQIIWTATDAAGNTATATQTVVIQDTTPPVMTAPAAVTVDSTTGQPIAVAIGQATATDAFTPVTVGNNAPAVFPIGITTVTWTATDPNGNSATATQTVTVNNASLGPLVGLPPDPGLAGQATLAGIDSDNDGVRDDVQRWITLTYPNSQKTRAALIQDTKEMQQILLDAADPVKSRNNAILESRAIECLSYVRPNDFYTVLEKHQATFLNTSLRSKAWIQADRHSSGGFFNLLSDPKMGCAFDPDALPN